MSDLSTVDIIFYAIIIISTLWGMFRGLTHQAISLLFLVIAYFVSKHFAGDLAGESESKVVDTFYYAVSFAGIFVSVVVGGMIVNFIVSRLVNATPMAVVNKMLGGTFGLLRGILVCMVLTYFVHYTPIKDTAAWEESTLVPHLHYVNELFMGSMGEDVDMPKIPGDLKSVIPDGLI